MISVVDVEAKVSELAHVVAEQRMVGVKNSLAKTRGKQLGPYEYMQPSQGTWLPFQKALASVQLHHAH
jgi:hypothetical protein